MASVLSLALAQLTLCPAKQPCPALVSALPQCAHGVLLAPRYRHLMTDITALIPHSKKDSKLDTKNDRNVLNEVADMKVC